jgi:hypothetical protein
MISVYTVVEHLKIESDKKMFWEKQNCEITKNHELLSIRDEFDNANLFDDVLEHSLSDATLDIVKNTKFNVLNLSSFDRVIDYLKEEIENDKKKINSLNEASVKNKSIDSLTASVNMLVAATMKHNSSDLYYSYDAPTPDYDTSDLEDDIDTKENIIEDLLGIRFSMEEKFEIYSNYDEYRIIFYLG